MVFIGVVLGFIIAFLALSFFGAWILMLIAGALAGYHNWHSPGFWETWLFLQGLAIVGRAFFPTKLDLNKDK